MAPAMSKDQIIMICLSGRGDKDAEQIAARLGMEI
jgi:tryptophan synthase beta chain